jgi:hypothetical protein
VLLKTNDEEKREFLKHFIHQANVNRDKVVRCILGMKARRHRAYVHVDETKVREKAKQLPANGIPLELISLLPNDNSFEKLHVQKATVPGSWVGGACGCGKKACRISRHTTRQECSQCRSDRKSKHRVTNASDDTRHVGENFLTAPAIFPNNDIKYEANKTRAQIYAIQTKQAITWSVAKDVPTNKVHDASIRRY